MRMFVNLLSPLPRIVVGDLDLSSIDLALYPSPGPFGPDPRIYCDGEDSQPVKSDYLSPRRIEPPAFLLAVLWTARQGLSQTMLDALPPGDYLTCPLSGVPSSCTLLLSDTCLIYRLLYSSSLCFLALTFGQYISFTYFA